MSELLPHSELSAGKVATVQTERWALKDLRPHPENPRDHPRVGSKDWKVLEGSLRHDYFDPIVLNRRNGFIVSGHLRTKVLLHLGFTHADVSVVDYDELTHLARMRAANAPTGKDNADKLDALLAKLREASVDPVLALLNKLPTAAQVPSPLQDLQDAVVLDRMQTAFPALEIKRAA